MIEYPKNLKDTRIHLIKLQRGGSKKAKQPFPGEDGWNPFREGYNKKHNYPYTSKLIQIHLADGNNYGVIMGLDNLIAIDADNQKFAEEVWEKLPPTFCVQTGRGQQKGASGGYHSYYFCPDFNEKVILETSAGVHLGEVQGKGSYVVGPGSIHPNGKKYEVLMDLPINSISKDQLFNLISPYIKGGVVVRQKRTIPTLRNPESEFPITSISGFPWGLKETGRGEYQGSHPVHGSDSGTNFHINAEKNRWHCFRHQCGGGPLSLVALLNNVSECGERVEKLTHKLTTNQIKEARKIAIQDGLIIPKRKKSDENEMVDFENLAQEIMSDHTIFTDPNGETILFYHPETGTCTNDGDVRIKQIARRMAIQKGEKITTYLTRETLAYIRESTIVEHGRIDGNPNLIHLGNCILNTNTLETQPFTPEIIATQRISVDYNPNADCPGFKNFLSEILLPQDILTVQEMIGYLFRKDYSIQSAIIFLGEGANGKSTLLNAITQLIGRKNVSAVELQTLAKERFSRAQLYGKLANICPDISSGTLKYTGSFKTLMGDLVHADRKNKEPIEFFNFAKLLFSANQLPATKDDTTAFYRRFVIIDFPHSFRGREKDPNKLAEITTPEELQGILNWGIEGLRRLLANQRFSSEVAPETLADFWEKRSNPAAQFLHDFVKETQSEEDWIGKTELFEMFVRQHGPSMSQMLFNTQVLSFFNGVHAGQRKTPALKVWRRIKKSERWDAPRESETSPNSLAAFDNEKGVIA